MCVCFGLFWSVLVCSVAEKLDIKGGAAAGAGRLLVMCLLWSVLLCSVAEKLDVKVGAAADAHILIACGARPVQGLQGVCLWSYMAHTG